MPPVVKRARTGEGAGPPSAGADGDSTLEGLASWCDDKLRVFAADAPSFGDPDEGSPNQFVIDYVDNEFEDFLDTMKEEQRIGVDEVNKGTIADSWRKAGEDACRVFELEHTFSTSNNAFRNNFNLCAHSDEALTSIAEQTAEHFDHWYFNLGWSLANKILQNGGEELGSDSDDEDEPVEESDSDEEEEEEDSDSASGSGSESGENEDEEGGN